MTAFGNLRSLYTYFVRITILVIGFLASGMLITRIQYFILYFRITYKNVVIKKKETQRLALYQGSPKEKNIKLFKVTIQKQVLKI